MIPLLAASEKGKGQTESLAKASKRCGEGQWLSQWIEFLWNEKP